MKRSVSVGAVALLSACGLDNEFTEIDIPDEEVAVACQQEIPDGVIPYDRVIPEAQPLNVSYMSPDYELVEVFTGYRYDIAAVFATPVLSGDYHYHPGDISAEVTEFDYTDASFAFQNGDFQVSVDLGGYVGLEEGAGIVLITNPYCNEFYGYAGYEFVTNEQPNLLFYMDENGDLVEL